MYLIPCTHDAHAEAILAILNHAIVHSTALYDYEPRKLASMAPWFAAKQAGDYPVLGFEDDAGQLLGFASYGPFRAWPAYKYTVEHAVYIHPDHQRRGLGVQLMHHLIAAAVAQQYHLLVGCIDSGNAASIALHRKLGFVHAGTLTNAGFKFGRWLDLAFYQLTLPTPADPRDG